MLDQLIITTLRKEGRSMNYKQLAAALKLSPEQKKSLQKKLKKLASKGKIDPVGRGKYSCIDYQEMLTGTLHHLSKYSTVVVTDSGDEIPLAKNQNIRAFEGDTVSIILTQKSGKKNKRLIGEIVEINQHKRELYIGTLSLKNEVAFVILDEKRIYVDFFIPQGDLNGAQDGDKVTVELKDWPEKVKNPFGKIHSIIGKAGTLTVEMEAVLTQFGLTAQFPSEVNEETDKLPHVIPQKDIDARLDIRDILTFTIDPDDAKDFDDALSFEKLDHGQYRIGVHIADVTHYVRPGSKLDKEAFNRATSVYLVDRVIPMLPERISNELCSLRPNEDSLTFSAFFTINPNGEILDTKLARTVIHSDYRFTYSEALDILNDNHSKSEFKESLDTINELAKILRTKRLNNGAYDFNRAELRFKVEDGQLTGTVKKEGNDATKLIEEWMLMANKLVASTVGLKKDNTPTNHLMMYRVHDYPNEERLENLRAFLKQYDFQLDTSNYKNLNSNINTIIKAIQNEPYKESIQRMIIQSMSKAQYSIDNIGHFGLQFDYYSHFTSPIRRYPDVITHRLLADFLKGKVYSKNNQFEEKARHCSFRERKAIEAERESSKCAQAIYLKDLEGQPFEGVITGVTEWGLFVELVDNGCEGMLRTKDLPRDYYIYDATKIKLTARRTQKQYKLGDSINIRIKRVNVTTRHIDFAHDEF